MRCITSTRKTVIYTLICRDVVIRIGVFFSARSRKRVRKRWLRFVTDYDPPVRVIAGSLRGTIPRWFEFSANSLLCPFDTKEMYTFARGCEKLSNFASASHWHSNVCILVVRSRRERTVRSKLLKTEEIVNAEISRLVLDWYAGNLLVTYFFGYE